MNEHRLYIVLGLLLLVMGALAVRRHDPIGSTAFLIAGTGAVANGANALRKRINPQLSPQMLRLRLGLLLFGILSAIVLILLEERGGGGFGGR
jgi:drug/metabolite transporter (DMT)-like permease